MASTLWQKLTYSRSLFGLLLLNLFWCASLFIAPMLLAPGTFAWPYSQYPTVANHLGGANQLDYEPIWQMLWIYQRAVYTFGDIQCHQLWFRSFYINGNQMPMCERMTSMYIFANLGLVAAAFARPSTSTGQVMLNSMPEFIRRRLARFGSDRAGATIIIVGLIPMAIDGFTQLFRINNYESTPLARVITGGIAGYVGGLLVGAMLVTIRQFSMEMAEFRARMQLRATPEH